MRKGKFNHLVVILGVPNTGKTTYAVKRAREIQRESKCIITVYDPDYRLPEDDASIIHYESYAECVAGMKSRPGAIHCITTGKGEDFVTWARECGKASVNNPQKEGAPVLAMIDDSAQISGFSRRGIADHLLEALTGRRHKHTGFIITLQDPQFGHYSLMSQSTELVIFRIIDEKALLTLGRFGITPDMQARIKSLPDYQCIVHYTNGRPA